jgi:DNA polymerase-3 subunit gamma/tau
MSEPYQVLARKYRPHTFSEMVGQTHTVKTLINALDSNNLHHGFLFTGTRGVGKTTIARIFAKSINCESGVSSKPCGKCATCIEIDKGQSIDFFMREFLQGELQATREHGHRYFLWIGCCQ